MCSLHADNFKSIYIIVFPEAPSNTRALCYRWTKSSKELLTVWNHEVKFGEGLIIIFPVVGELNTEIEAYCSLQGNLGTELTSPASARSLNLETIFLNYQVAITIFQKPYFSNNKTLGDSIVWNLKFIFSMVFKCSHNYIIHVVIWN